MTLLEMSVSAMLLVAVIAAIRGMGIHKLPKKLLLVFWGIVLFRLLVPFEIQSPLSVYSAANRVQYIPEFTQGISQIENFVKTSAVSMPTVQAVPRAITDTQPLVAASISPFVIIWIVGMAALAIYMIAVHLRCLREYSASLPVENNFVAMWMSQNKLRRQVQVRQTDKIVAPLTYGILKPVILLPKTMDWQNEQQLQLVLAHEMAHIRRFDTLWKLVLATALCVHWFNPLVWVMYVLANRDIELACDEAVVRRMGEGARDTYAMALIDMEERKSRLFSVNSFFSKNTVKERIKAIMKTKKISAGILIAAMVLMLGVTTVFATSAMDVSKTEYLKVNYYAKDGWNIGSDIDMTGRWTKLPEKERKALVQETFQEYEAHGMRFDAKEERFYFDGKLVRCFWNPPDKEKNRGTGFENMDGEIDLIAVRDDAYRLTGIEAKPKKEFERETSYLEDIERLEALGFEDNPITGNCAYQGKTVNHIYIMGAVTTEYEDGTTTWSYGFGSKEIAEDGLYLEVKRDEQGKILELVPMQQDNIKMFKEY